MSLKTAFLPSLFVLSLSACGGESDDGSGDEETATSASEMGESSSETGEGDGDGDGDGDGGGNGDGDGDGDGDGCTQVTASEWIGIGADVEGILGPLAPQIGDPEVNDVLQIELYNVVPSTGESIDLGAAPNDNYATCDQCVRVLEDVVGVAASKVYYQQSGTIVFEELAGVGQWRGYLQDVTMVEVEIDGAFNSTPVEGGGCMSVVGQLEFDTLPSGG